MSSDQTQYYVRRQGRVEGPWPVSKLRTEVSLKRLSRYHEVSPDGKNWQTASFLEELFRKSAQRKVVGGAGIQAAPQPSSETHEYNAIWYCSLDGAQQGPMTESALSLLVSSGQMKLDDYVWREGFPDWIPLEEVSELSQLYSDDGVYDASTSLVGATQLLELPSAAPKKLRFIWIGAFLGTLMFFFIGAITVYLLYR